MSRNDEVQVMLTFTVWSLVRSIVDYDPTVETVISPDDED